MMDEAGETREREAEEERGEAIDRRLGHTERDGAERKRMVQLER